MNIRIIVDEVHHPFCEASPDFCNWEHEYLMYNGLAALAPYALEYEDGPWDGIEGSKYLFKEVMAAL